MPSDLVVQGDSKIEARHDGEKNEVEASTPSPEEVKPSVETSRAGAQAASGPSAEFLSRRLAGVEQRLDDYCSNPTAASFMQIYTCIYDLCNCREHKTAVCRAVYELYRRETELCVKQLHESCARLSEQSCWRCNESPQVLLEWRRLERRFHALQVSFAYLDRYHVPRANLESLTIVRQSAVEAAGLEEHARTMWNAIVVALQNGCVQISFAHMQEIADAWRDLAHMVGMKEGSAAISVSHTLREHLAGLFTDGRYPIGRPNHGTAAARVLGTQRPLARLTLEFLSEQDLCKVYSVQNKQRSI
jgi:hypothetical protein